MKKILCRQAQAAIFLLPLVMTACLGAASAPTHFYMLSPISPPQTGNFPVNKAARLHIGLESVVVAEYLNRNQIVVNLDNTVYRFAEFDQWAEPLSNNLTRVLQQNLTNLLRDDSIDVFVASQSSVQFDYRLEIDVIRLDGNLADQATLVAQWALLEGAQDRVKLIRRSQYQEAAADNTYRALVLAKSRAVEKLSREIAADIKKALGSR